MVMSYVSNARIELNQVKRLPVPLTAMCQALLSHQVDAVAIYSLFYIACERQNPGKLTMLAKDSDAIPEAAKIYSAYVFADDYIKAHPDVVRAYVAAMKDAMRYIEANPEDAKAIVSQQTKIAPDLLFVPTFAPKGCFDQTAAAGWVKLLEKYKMIPEGSVQPTSWITNQFNPDCT
jgi:ABC-type nitrate/sulfonate/bicarbonate transport system substrate-binding protein